MSSQSDETVVNVIVPMNLAGSLTAAVVITPPPPPSTTAKHPFRRASSISVA